MNSNTKNILKGSDVMLFMENKAIAYATSASISISSDTSEISCKDFSNGWASSMITKRSWTCSSENLFGTTVLGGHKSFIDLFNAYKNGTEVAISLIVTPNGYADERVAEVPEGGWTASKTLLSGSCIITSLSLNADNSDNASFSVEFTGVSELKATEVSGE